MKLCYAVGDIFKIDTNKIPMQKVFNTTGPCFPQEHYMLKTSERIEDIMPLIDSNTYFVIHAPRQSGKTTFLFEMVNRINAGGEYYALYCTLETVQTFNEAKDGMLAIISCIETALQAFPNIPNRESFAHDANYEKYNNVLTDSLRKFCSQLDKPLVIFFDEADCLSGDVAISFLRQLRDGYVNRGFAKFVHSIALIGMRDIRDYKAKVRHESQTLGSASPFNIMKESLMIRNFNYEEVAELYKQHTDATGQLFEQDAVNLVSEKTQGQPWLVNAIACEIIEKQLKKDYTKSITAVMVEEAIQTIIKRRDVHIDSLLERLKEERVRRIIEPIITGGDIDFDDTSDDYLFVRDLGLIRRKDNKLQISNPIYAEVLVRVLSYRTQYQLEVANHPYNMPRYLKDGIVDIDYLLQDFQNFWRENGESWAAAYDYQEAGPHLVLHGFLQRVVSGGGQIIREMAAGRGRSDICIIFNGKKYPIEIKIHRGTKTLAEGLEQIGGYMDRLGCDEGWLIIFDRRKKIAWSRKLFTRVKQVGVKKITVVDSVFCLFVL